MTISSGIRKYSGLKIPFLATSIIPPETNTPTITPIPATIIIVLNFAALAPIAEFRKFTASLATPTVKSMIAKRIRITRITRLISTFYIFFFMNYNRFKYKNISY
jgi:hypothetical protein